MNLFNAVKTREAHNILKTINNRSVIYMSQTNKMQPIILHQGDRQRGRRKTCSIFEELKSSSLLDS